MGLNYLKEKFADKKIILGSGSPRRSELLSGLNIPFEVTTKKVDESYPNVLEKEQITKYIVKQKAIAFEPIANDEIVITADTIVWCDNIAIPKPKDEKEAREILKYLSGKMHKVFTSVCIQSVEKTIVFTESTKVYFKPLDNNEIDYYINQYQPFDKAGAYGIQEWLGFIGINRIEGSYYNVMGLPVAKLYQVLKTF